MSKDFDSMIVTNEIKRDSIIGQMEDKKNQFLQEAMKFTQECPRQGEKRNHWQS